MRRSVSILVPDYWNIGEVYERLIEDSYGDEEVIKGILGGISLHGLMSIFQIIITDFLIISHEIILQRVTRKE